MKTPDTLVLFTSEFPCGNGEPFIVNEFKVLCTKFKKVIIFPRTYSASKPVVSLPSNVVIENIGECTRNNVSVLFGNIFLVISVLLNEIFLSKKKGTFIKNIREFNSYFLSSIELSERIAQQIEGKNLKDAVFYSFWMDKWALSLATLKKKKIISRFIFRANGFDLYENQTKYNYIPFRPFIFSQANKMFAVSKKGADCMKSIDVNEENITHSYFGTEDFGLSEFSSQEKFTIFTCSDLRKLKRADRMADILKHINFPVKWIHHGHKGSDEEIFYSKVKNLPPNVEFEMHERKEDYADVLLFFKKNHFNLFVLLSETEGIPVSLIEAISFGIPILATDVGGVSEVLNGENGILINKDFNDKEVADKIIEFAQKSSLNTKPGREKIREGWKNRFSSQNNYELFYNQIINS